MKAGDIAQDGLLLVKKRASRSVSGMTPFDRLRVNGFKRMRS